jgi:hypothetical protein
MIHTYRGPGRNNDRVRMAIRFVCLLVDEEGKRKRSGEIIKSSRIISFRSRLSEMVVT